MSAMVQVTTKLRAADAAKLARVAKRTERSISATIRLAIYQYLDGQKA